jgi:acetyltransferase
VNPSVRIDRLDALDTASVEGLAELLVDAIDGGASMGFHAPLRPSVALAYWHEVAVSLDADNALWIARDAARRVVGSVQWQRAGRENGRHRAEVCKLLVLRDARRAGIAAQLMAALEAHARAGGVTLLVLDTEAGSAAESFYRSQGWQRVGEIPGFASRADGSLTATALYFKTQRGNTA